MTYFPPQAGKKSWKTHTSWFYMIFNAIGPLDVEHPEPQKYKEKETARRRRRDGGVVAAHDRTASKVFQR